jgi:hypothetical protein
MVLVVANDNSDRPLLYIFCIDWILGSKYDGLVCCSVRKRQQQVFRMASIEDIRQSYNYKARHGVEHNV